ncbi:hypothetical protein Pedsa_1228 [Pseudopedobacter saltans DSM 12145]|uniref:Adenylosuccinate lyase n=1 Tax=Pseudopedobacter saltans (strain ATCC 51119 / DSM 12145 / JCM 21818 / CCUG 39354 / LMG 10337 / NBRC 100064 / NCIMB 13643) TaxID=762903 RepID=F0SD39_PSESL|nr:hypothetical protein [Pseudopedobacter saltans]ADY51796.1 hypothetical protein Pedsa_1228 [Pseudopedobacter saltans DSM 12145]
MDPELIINEVLTKEVLADVLKENHSKSDIRELTRKANRKYVKVRDVYELTLEHEDPQVVFRSAWLLENIFFDYPEEFEYVQPLFFKDYSRQKNKSAQRHYSKIAKEVTYSAQMCLRDIKPGNFDVILEGSFDWLIDPETPVAVKCNCLDVLYNLSEQEDWILPELKNILEQNLLSNSAALLSRTKSILKKLKP